MSKEAQGPSEYHKNLQFPLKPVQIGHLNTLLRLKQMQTVHSDTVDSFKKSLADIQQNMEAKQEHSKRVAEVEVLSNNLNQLAG
jgi:hypothetical protein